MKCCAIVLYMFTFVTKSVAEMIGYISEVELGYTVEMGGYVNMKSDIVKLPEIAIGELKGGELYESKHSRAIV